MSDSSLDFSKLMASAESSLPRVTKPRFVQITSGHAATVFALDSNDDIWCAHYLEVRSGEWEWRWQQLPPPRAKTKGGAE